MTDPIGFIFPDSIVVQVHTFKDSIIHFDKLIHILCYAILLYLLSLIFTSIKLVYLFFAMLMFGFVIEVLQSFAPERNFDWVDFTANFVGLTLAYLFVLQKQESNNSMDEPCQ